MPLVVGPPLPGSESFQRPTPHPGGSSKATAMSFGHRRGYSILPIYLYTHFDKFIIVWVTVGLWPVVIGMCLQRGTKHTDFLPSSIDIGDESLHVWAYSYKACARNKKGSQLTHSRHRRVVKARQ